MNQIIGNTQNKTCQKTNVDKIYHKITSQYRFLGIDLGGELGSPNPPNFLKLLFYWYRYPNL